MQRTLLLIHGLLNWHPWRRRFLRELALALPGHQVVLVYTDACTRVWRRDVGGITVFGCGRDWPYLSGRQALSVQVQRVQRKWDLLRRQHGLAAPIDVIGHSLGGLVARLFAEQESGLVRHVVTVATPHHGTPLATQGLQLAGCLGWGQVLRELTPAAMAEFNRDHPLQKLRLAPGGRVFTLRGRADGTLRNWGTCGEVWYGFRILSRRYGQASDGLVPHDSACLDGAVHLGDFPYDHRALIHRVQVARRIAEVLHE
ncbi:esterase/lipase family protein [Alicyclobacillus shizuokensis]|uniref:esterase/lipase family protein n=1 Tax=Alicyclobacillus shizuokensis TaxID=392014 RepID=UPI000AC69CEF|nr:alpha/beta fold hydrolase [Alicyclobacillus shizuokensis]